MNKGWRRVVCPAAGPPPDVKMTCATQSRRVILGLVLGAFAASGCGLVRADRATPRKPKGRADEIRGLESSASATLKFTLSHEPESPDRIETTERLLPGDSTETFRQHLAPRFAEYLESETPLAAVTLDDDEAPVVRAPGSTLYLRTDVSIERTSYRTYFLDMLSLYGIPGWLTPSWGEIRVSLKTEIKDGSNAVIGVFEHEETVPYSAAWFSWYRTEYIDLAYRLALQIAFKAAAQAIKADFDSLLARASRGRPTESDIDPREDTQYDKHNNDFADGPIQLHVRDRSEFDEWLRINDDLRSRIIMEDDRPPADSLAGVIGRALGGVELEGFGGMAEVESSLSTENGETPVARGRARVLGYQIGLFSPPNDTGFFIFPTGGFRSQDITISDFREDLPSYDVEQAREISAICRDLDSGVEVGCDIPNRYELDLRSFYAGARLGGRFVGGTRQVRVAFELSGGLNALEYRHVSVAVGDFRQKKWNFASFSSFAAGAAVTVHFPYRFGFRIGADYERYLRFDYPRGLNFRGAADFDEDRQAFLRPVLTLEDVNFSSWNVQGAVFVTF